MSTSWARPEDAVQPAPVAMRVPEHKPVPVVRKAVALPGPFTVFFALDSDEVTSIEQRTVAALIDAYRTAKPTSIYVAGYADTTGSDAHNDKLSMMRALSVKKMLATAGVPDAAIRVEAMGARSPKVATGPGVAEQKNRVVDVSFSN